MPLHEFDIIKKYFTRPSSHVSVEKSVGDDCAIVNLDPNKQLLMSMDTLVSGRHFFEDAAPKDIASRALCTSLSDLAAMGATPRWFTLGLTLPSCDEEWLQQFSQGLFAIADAFAIDLIGGDTTQGPLAITVQVHGEVDHGCALRRDQAQVGDEIFVTGCLGDGAAALALLQHQVCVDHDAQQYLLHRFYSPTPQIDAGRQLRGLAHAAIDISDGLLADAQHIANASHVALHLNIDRLPVSSYLHSIDSSTTLPWALCGGDDYQLLFTVGRESLSAVHHLIKQGKLDATSIGHVVEGEPNVQCFMQGEPYHLDHRQTGYKHFAS